MSLILDSIVAVQRLTKDTDNTDKEQYQDNAALQVVKCQIQPATPQQTAIVEGVYGQIYMMFTTESGVLTGDKVTVSGTGQAYRVRGIEAWDMDAAPHFEITLVRLEEEEVLT